MENAETSIVFGGDYPPPRITGAGLRYMLLIVGAVTLATAALLDRLFYLFFQEVLGRYYGVLCLI